jgi:hypothetical protein
MSKRRNGRHRRRTQREPSAGQHAPQEARSDLPDTSHAWSEEMADDDTEEMVTDDQIVEMVAN